MSVNLPYGDIIPIKVASVMPRAWNNLFKETYGLDVRCPQKLKCEMMQES